LLEAGRISQLRPQFLEVAQDAQNIDLVLLRKLPGALKYPLVVLRTLAGWPNSQTASIT